MTTGLACAVVDVRRVVVGALVEVDGSEELVLEVGGAEDPHAHIAEGSATRTAAATTRPAVDTATMLPPLR